MSIVWMFISINLNTCLRITHKVFVRNLALQWAILIVNIVTSFLEHLISILAILFRYRQNTNFRKTIEVILMKGGMARLVLALA